MFRLRPSIVAAALCLLLFAAPSPAFARVVVTVEFALGGAVVGGIGFFLHVAGSWEIPFAGRDVPTALLEFSDGRARLGVPVPALRVDADPGSNLVGETEIQFDLFRWRF